MSENPFNLMHGRMPSESFVNRSYIVDNILSVFDDDTPALMTYAITGVRGSGKTVLLRDIVNKISLKNNWVTIDLNLGSNLVNSLANKLLHSGKQYKLFLDWKLTISASLISLMIGKSKESITDPEIILEEMLKNIRKLIYIAVFPKYC